MRDAVFERDGGRCGYCRLAQFGHGATFHIDHIIPRSKGGLTTLENLVLQCPNCSLRKADRIEAIDCEGGDSVAIFDPLRNPWDEHFQLQADGICLGLTPCGPATVLALGMNRPIPRFARLCQIMLGLLS